MITRSTRRRVAQLSTGARARKAAVSARAPVAAAESQHRADRSVRKADTVADALMRRIASGEITVGSILPREDELAREHGTSRSVVREAIKLLEVHRLVRPVRRRGTEVLDPLASLSPEVLRALLVPKPGQLDRRMLAGLLEVRAQLDVQMSSAAAARRTKADLEALEASLDRIAATRADPIRYAETAPELAIAIARATQNPVFVMLAHWNRLVNRDLDELFKIVRPANESHYQGLRLIVDLIRKKDVAGLEALVSQFHAWATPRLLAAADLHTGGGAYPSR